MQCALRPDTSWVYVDVGLGFHAQMTPAEAIAFSTQRESQLSKAAEALTQQAAKLKAQVTDVDRPLMSVAQIV